MDVRFSIRFDRVAIEDIQDFLAYLDDFSPDVSSSFADSLKQVIDRDLGGNPLRYSWFWQSGPPFRARLFRVSRRTAYWIIYEVDEPNHRVTILRFWNASRDPAAFEL